jgi:hypothetical protein
MKQGQSREDEKGGAGGGLSPPPPPPPAPLGKVTMMQGERVVFTEKNNPQTGVKLIASGEVDDSLLEALEDYVKRQRKRLEKKEAANRGGLNYSRNLYIWSVRLFCRLLGPSLELGLLAQDSKRRLSYPNHHRYPFWGLEPVGYPSE